MTTKTEAAHDVRKVLEVVKEFLAQPSRPKLSEADTRAHFIDPLLRALGYHKIGDVQHEVFVETAHQYLDYLLVVDALPRAAVEAKAFEVPFSDQHGAQVVQYCSVLGVEWAIVTNAREWRLYHGFETGPLAAKLVFALDLVGWSTDSQYDTVFERLWLTSKESFQTSGGPNSFLVKKQLDALLRKSLLDTSSPELKYLRKRLSEQGASASAEDLAGWFKSHLDGGSSEPKEPNTVPAPQMSPVPQISAAGQATANPPSDASKRKYLRLMLGAGSVHADTCRAGGFVGTDFGLAHDLTHELPDDWTHFNQKFVPVYLGFHPDKKPVAAGLACGAIWTVSKSLQDGDVVLCPNGKGSYMVGRISGGYYYAPGAPLQHRRPVVWLDKSIPRAAMSQPLRNSTGSIGTICDVTKYSDEIEELIGS